MSLCVSGEAGESRLFSVSTARSASGSLGAESGLICSVALAWGEGGTMLKGIELAWGGRGTNERFRFPSISGIISLSVCLFDTSGLSSPFSLLVGLYSSWNGL